MWDKAPQEVLLAVFKHLDQKDLCAASIVCKRWTDLSRRPCLWRTLVLQFMSNKMVLERAPRHIQFLDVLGHHLQHLSVEIRWWKEEFTGVQQFVDLLDKVNEVAELRSVHFRFEMDPTEEQRQKVLQSFCALLKDQRHLKSLEINCSLRLTLSESQAVLDALSACEGDGHTRSSLAFLDIENLYMYPGLSLSRMLVSSFGRLSGIRYLCLDWRTLDAPVLGALTTSSRHTIQKIKIVVDTIHEPSEDSGLISPRDWREVVSRCPRLQVHVNFIGVESLDVCKRILVGGMPLSELTTCGWLGQADVVDKLLMHLAHLYSQTLAVLSLRSWPWPEQEPMRADEGLLRLVSDCQHLRVLFLDIPLTVLPEILDGVHKALTYREDQGLEPYSQMLLAVNGLPKTMKSPDYTLQRWPNLHSALHTDSWAQKHCSGY